jgi:hypothetical protein
MVPGAQEISRFPVDSTKEPRIVRYIVTKR